MKPITTVMLALSIPMTLTALGCAETRPAERATAATLEKVDVPAPVAVSPTAKVALKLHAVGAQIYTCAAVADAPAGSAPTYRWKLKAPEAELFDGGGAVAVGSHGAGPSWRYKDGSAFVGAKVAEAKAPGQEDIPWLLLRAVSHQGEGVLANVTFAQRVNTSKGKAPEGGCDASTKGQETRTSYSADYIFYTGGNESAEGTAPAATRAN